MGQVRMLFKEDSRKQKIEITCTLHSNRECVMNKSKRATLTHLPQARLIKSLS